MTATQRNEPCPCGSGKKYKHCCRKSGGGNRASRERQLRIAGVLAALVAVAAAATGWFAGRDAAGLVALAGFLAIGAYLLFADPPAPKSGGRPGAINFGG